ncbi:MAG: tetratricopeptide repeat protein [Gammaproteobacteria bacterium]|nr:tetratricopeptide repeat protein [Rhodocyclaceae bacterium]MBU3910602.1 tetratricopeptide repeat protein [Gammaproteobacteria bacterium]MBU3989481.1 tetratricopeptide repeat protein [Gammaproteobacteria bacterium]MBU4005083.1 tetratricopeptide repeat protein [Gammaproteobacteria bacterium]MBU4020676.1 tetratricopeptide repeat protein [Gammaproteobacteria bacterium]
MNYDHWRHYARGWVFHFLGQVDVAYAAYAEAFRIDPSDIQSARHLAAIAVERQRWDEAEAWYQTSLDLLSTDADTWFNLGFVRERAAKSAEAIAAFSEAVRLKPAQDRAWYGMGLAHARLGQHAAAASALQQAVKLQPMNGEAFYQLGMALHHAERPDELKPVVIKLAGFEPKRARKLVQDAGRADLLPLIPDLPF